MKTNPDKLRELFNQIKIEESSAFLTEKIMKQIHIESITLKRENEFKNSILAILGICCSVVAIIMIPFVFFLIEDVQLSSMQIKFPDITSSIIYVFSTLKFSSFISSIGCIILLLLLIDLFVRKVKNENKKDWKMEN